MELTNSKISLMQFGLDVFVTFKADAKAIEEIEKLQNKFCDITLREHKEIRSLNANAYFHKLCNEIAKVVNKSDTEIKRYLNTEYGTIYEKDGSPVCVTLPKDADISLFYDYARWIKDSPDGKFSAYVLYKPTHTLNTAEMTKLIEGTQSEAKDLSIQTLDDIRFKDLMEAYEHEINNSK